MKLLCKNDQLNFTINWIPIQLTIGKYYYLSQSNSILTYSLDSDDDGRNEFFFFKVEGCPPYIWNFFYTIQEERKLKLEQLESLIQPFIPNYF